jgi:hypothetical protein
MRLGALAEGQKARLRLHLQGQRAKAQLGRT